MTFGLRFVTLGDINRTETHNLAVLFYCGQKKGESCDSPLIEMIIYSGASKITSSIKPVPSR